MHQSINVGPFDLARSLDVATNRTAMIKGVASFRCPSDDGPVTNNARLIRTLLGATYEITTANYVAVNSSNEICRDKGPPGDTANGIFYRNSNTKIGGITDGTSNTVMLRERAWQMRLDSGGFRLGRAAVLFGIRGVRHKSEQGMADAMGCGAFRMNFSSITGDIPDSKARQGFSSQHTGGAIFATGDGSVRFISQSIDADSDANQVAKTIIVNSIYEALMGVDDGVVIGEF